MRESTVPHHSLLSNRLLGGLFAGVVLGLAVLLGVGGAAPAAEAADGPPVRSGRLKIVATLFPQYDFARQIAGNRADVRLLLPPGAESHSFEPTPADMRDVSRADVFIYTGEHMEPWAKRIVDAHAAGAVMVVDASAGIELHDDHESHEDEGGDGRANGKQADGERRHGKYDALMSIQSEHAKAGGGEESGSGEGEGDGHVHAHDVDPHIWLDPVMAGVMADNIGSALADRDPDNAQHYLENTLALCAELDRLDADFAARVRAAGRRLLVFGERFAFAYFFKRYGLESASPYNSCAVGAEPGLRAVIDTINLVKREGIEHIYAEAYATSRMASLISRETGADVLYVDSLHNPPLERQLAGISYQSVMRENMDAFARGLE